MQRKHYIFVDYENVQDIDVSLIDGKPVELILVLGEKQERLPVELVKAMLLHAPQVKLIQSGASGRNALDLILSHHIGLIRATDPHGFFYVVAKDKGYDALIKHLRMNKVLTNRHDRLCDIPVLQAKEPLVNTRLEGLPTNGSATKKQTPKATDPIETLVSEFKTHPLSRPRTLNRLIEFVKSHLGKKHTDEQASALIGTLCKRRHLALSNSGSVKYCI